jgi:hypothetical protein
MVFDIYNEEQAKQMLKFAIENDFEFNVDKNSIYDLFIKEEIMDQLEWIYEGVEFADMLTKYDSNELQEFVIKRVKSDIEQEASVWDDLDNYSYDRICIALYAFEEMKEKKKIRNKG